MQKAVHGGDLFGISEEMGIPVKELIDFSANINPLGVPETVLNAMRNAVDTVSDYPDPWCRSLRRMIADSYGLSEYKVFCGNGAADIIYRIVYALKPETAMVTAPSFLEYEEALTQTKTDIKYYQLDDTMQVKDDIISMLDQKIDLLFLCNPNNPTGILIDEELLKRIIKVCYEKHIWLVLDECFLDFVQMEDQKTMIPWIETCPNLLILRSFTKMFAIPGIRAGYVVCDEKMVERLQNAGQTWPVNTVAQAAAKAAMQENHFKHETREYIETERKWLTKELRNLGIQVYDSVANYIFFRCEKENNLYDRLLKYGMIIRKCENYAGLSEQYYRIAVKKHSENERLVEVLKNLWQK